MEYTYILVAEHIKNKEWVAKIIAKGTWQHCLEALNRNEKLFKGYYLSIKEFY